MKDVSGIPVDFFGIAPQNPENYTLTTSCVHWCKTQVIDVSVAPVYWIIALFIGWCVLMVLPEKYSKLGHVLYAIAWVGAIVHNLIVFFLKVV